jgi:HAD superfamily hydrolase (TIGR01509 family)
MWVVFDLDGTLIDSEQVWADVRRPFVLDHGGTWHERAQATMIGMRTTEWAQYIHDDLGVALPPEQIAAQVVDAVTKSLVQSLPILPGAQAALERLAGAYPLGLATSAALPVARAVLEEAGWARFFKAVVSADEVVRGKPAPDVYLCTLELLGAAPAESAAVEDSANGIRSAAAAGLAVVAIPNHHYPPDADALTLAATVLPNLAALEPSVIRTAIARRNA